MVQAAPVIEQAGQDSVVVDQIGDWLVCEDAMGIFYHHVPTQQSFDNAPPEFSMMFPQGYMPPTGLFAQMAFAAPYAAPYGSVAPPVVEYAAPYGAVAPPVVEYAAPPVVGGVMMGAAPIGAMGYATPIQPNVVQAAPYMGTVGVPTVI
jgi:hypothetical protein